nr:set1:ash2 histone methyltransferase complex [Hymenolepis microstoma]
MEIVEADMAAKPESDDKLKELMTRTIPIVIAPGQQCYCGKCRDYSVAEFQCSHCYHWFHQQCINLDVGPAIPFMTAYHFMCKKCNNSQEEVFTKKQANYASMCQTVIANLMCASNGRSYFSLEKEVIPFLDQNWDIFTSQPRRSGSSLSGVLHKALVGNELFNVVDEGAESIVCLSCQELSTIGPSYERFRALTSQLKTSMSKRSAHSAQGGDVSLQSVGDGSSLITGDNLDSSLGLGKSLRKGSIAGSGGQAGQSQGREGGSGGGGNVRSTRRATAAAVAAGGGSGIFGASEKDDAKTKLTQFGFPVDHPLNTENYRYSLVEVDPHAKYRKQWEESEFTAGKPIPGYFYRVVLYPKVVLSLHDRAQKMKLSESQTVVTGEKGYSMIRATHSVHTGTWYFEATITEQPEGAATRIGWSQIMATLQAPCGFDKFSYSWRSRKGTVFHNSRGKHYAEEGYTKGDVIGCLIHLPKVSSSDMIPSSKCVYGIPTGPVKHGKSGTKGEFVKIKPFSEGSLANYLTDSYKDRPVIRFKHIYYFEDILGDAKKVEKQLKPLPQSSITFYRNGECLGTAFRDIYAGVYFPTISIYKSASVAVNFGPDFRFPPPESENWLPMSERRESMQVEQTMSDMMYLLANDTYIERVIKECGT